MSLYYVSILALYIAGMVLFAGAALRNWDRAVPLGLLCWITVGFTVTLNAVVN